MQMQGARSVLNSSCCCDCGFPALLHLLPPLDCHSEFLCWVMLCWASLLLGSLQISQFSFPIKIGKLQFRGTAALIEIALSLLVRAVGWGRKGEEQLQHKGAGWGQTQKRQGRTRRLHIRRSTQEKLRWCTSAQALFHCVLISYFNELRNLVQIRAKAESSPPVPSCPLTCSRSSVNMLYNAHN